MTNYNKILAEQVAQILMNSKQVSNGLIDLKSEVEFIASFGAGRLLVQIRMLLKSLLVNLKYL